MKLKFFLGASSALCLCATVAQAQTGTNSPADFDQRLKQMQEMFEQREQAMEARFEKKIAAQDAVIDALKKQIGLTPTNPPPESAAAPTNTSQVPDLFKELSDRVDNVVEAQKKVLPGEFNPAIGVVGETVFSYRDKGNDETGADRPGGFDVWQRSVELNAMASVDPFAKGWLVARIPRRANPRLTWKKRRCKRRRCREISRSRREDFSASSGGSVTFTTTNCRL